MAIRIGDLIGYRSKSGTIVKGKVTAVYSDPALGFVICFKVTSKDHGYFVRGSEVVLPLDDRFFVRERRV